MGKCGPLWNQTKYISFEMFWLKNVIFIEFEPLCQKFWAFVSNLPTPLTKYGHARKVTKFEGNWLKNKNVRGKKQIGGGKDPIVLIGLRQNDLMLQNVQKQLSFFLQS